MNSLRLEELLSHSGFVESLARGIAADALEADDLVQETWLAALRSPPADRTTERAWLAKVLRNVAATFRRRAGARSRREREAARNEAERPERDRIERMSEARQVLGAVLRLREPYRTVILRRYYDEQTPTQMAEASGDSLETVRTQLRRARAELRQDLERRLGKRGALWSLGLAAGFERPLVSPFIAPTASSAAAITTTSIGVAIVSSSTIVAFILGAVSVGGLAWWLARSPAPGTTPIVGVADPNGSEAETLGNTHEDATAALRTAGGPRTAGADVDPLLRQIEELLDRYAALLKEPDFDQSEAIRLLRGIISIAPPDLAQAALFDAMEAHPTETIGYRYPEGADEEIVRIWNQEPGLRVVARRELETTSHGVLQEYIARSMKKDKENFDRPEQSWLRVLRRTEDDLTFDALLANIINFHETNTIREAIRFAMRRAGPRREFTDALPSAYEYWCMMRWSWGDDDAAIHAEMVRDMTEVANHPDTHPYVAQHARRVLEKYGSEESDTTGSEPGGN